MLSVRDVGTLRLVLRMRRSWVVDMGHWVISILFIRCRLLRKYLGVVLEMKLIFLGVILLSTCWIGRM